jgi:hypothetical protein
MSDNQSLNKSGSFRIYNPNPYTVYSDYPNLDPIEVSKLDKPEESSGSFAFKLLSRLAGLWFITVAAGSVICSIPISAIGLPIIMGVGVTCLVILAIFQYIIRLYLQLLSLAWKAIKAVLFSPKHLIGFGVSLIRKVSHYFFHRNTVGMVDQHPYPSFPPLSRRLSTTSSRYTDRSYEGSFQINVDQYRWRYYEPTHQRMPITSLGDESSQLSSPREHRVYDYDVSIRAAPMNPQFMWLTPEHRDRLDYCRQLYSSTTNLPADQFDLLLGPQPDGSIHSILSLWNEPDPTVPLDYPHLIGFCQYYILPDKPFVLHIDKLNISSEYSENGTKDS